MSIVVLITGEISHIFVIIVMINVHKSNINLCLI